MLKRYMPLVAVSGLIALPQPASAAVTLDINQTSSTAPFGDLSGGEIISQSFKATVTNNAGVGFWLGSKPWGNVTYKLWDANPGLGTAALLASATVGAGYNAFADAFWTTPVALTVGNTYFISAQTDIVKAAQYGSKNPYVDGAVYIGSNQRTDVDLVFRTYTDNAFVTPTTPAVPELATWAMMIAGFGLVGGTMRRRNSAVTTRVSYAA